ncbi:MAG: KGG domain-containing protein [Gemmatimonadaceae bacterium]
MSANRGSSNNGQSDSISTPTRRSNRGFASMDRAKQKEIASKGGRAAHAKGTAHEFDSGEARDAGRKGGVAVSRNREHMAAIGRRGGEARGHARGASAAGSTKGMEGAQNSMNPNASGSDRQVAIDNQRDGMSQRATTSDKNSLGNERRPMSNGADSTRGQDLENR